MRQFWMLQLFCSHLMQAWRCMALVEGAAPQRIGRYHTSRLLRYGNNDRIYRTGRTVRTFDARRRSINALVNHATIYPPSAARRSKSVHFVHPFIAWNGVSNFVLYVDMSRFDTCSSITWVFAFCLIGAVMSSLHNRLQVVLDEIEHCHPLLWQE